MKTAEQPRNEALQRLLRASEDVHAAKARLHEEQEAAWQRYVAAVEAALAADLDLTTGAGTTTTAGPTEDPVHELLDTIRGRIDDLRVQAQLGRMEAAELLDELQTAVGWVIEHVRP